MSERLPVLFWYGTRAEYAAITAKQSNTLYFIAGENKLYRGEEAFAFEMNGVPVPLDKVKYMDDIGIN